MLKLHQIFNHLQIQNHIIQGQYFQFNLKEILLIHFIIKYLLFNHLLNFVILFYFHYLIVPIIRFLLNFIYIMLIFSFYSILIFFIFHLYLINCQYNMKAIFIMNLINFLNDLNIKINIFKEDFQLISL